MKSFLKNKIHKFPVTVTNKLQAGFTMVEMLVVLGIFAVITSVVVFNYGNFTSKTIMTNMAYEIALEARQAQVYSLSVRGQQGETNFINRYGVYFKVGETEPIQDFVFFIDRPTNNPSVIGNEGEFDSICTISQQGGEDCFASCTGDECLEKKTLTRDIFISQICVSRNFLEPFDSEGVCELNLNAVTVSFERPDPDALIYSVDSNLNIDGPYDSVAIVIESRFGDRRSVVIRKTGQISVEFMENVQN